jgi:hypothetical protein
LTIFSKTWTSFHSLSVGTDEKDNFSVFIDDNFCDLIAVESVGYTAERHWSLIKNGKYMATREIEACVQMLNYVRLVDLKCIFACLCLFYC